MGEIDGWVDTAIGMYLAIIGACLAYSFLGWLLWEYVIFPLFS